MVLARHWYAAFPKDQVAGFGGGMAELGGQVAHFRDSMERRGSLAKLRGGGTSEKRGTSPDLALDDDLILCAGW